MGVRRFGAGSALVWPTRPARITAVVMVVMTAAFVIAILTKSDEEVHLWRDMALYNGIFVAAALLMALRADAGGRSRLAWSLLALGMVLTVIGGVLWSFDPYVAFPDTTIPVPDLFWLAFYPLAFVAMLLLTRGAMPHMPRHNWLDGLIVGTGAFAVGMVVIMGPLSAGVDPHDTTAVIVNAIYPMGDLVLAAIALTAAQAFGWRPPLAWWFLFAGAMTFATADSFYLAQIASDSYVEGSLVDIGWPISAMLFGLAAYHDKDRTAAEHSQGPAAVAVPSVMLFAAALVLLVPMSGPLAWLTILSALTAISLSIGRMNVTVRDARLLSEKLKQATIDPLTGLVNRRGLHDQPRRGRTPTALVYLDLDGFGEINDTLGHHVGDRLLVLAAQRLRDGVRETDLVTRIGGDEFAVLLHDATEDAAAEVAEALIADLEEPITSEGITLHLSACAGVAGSTDPSVDYATLLQQADVALHEAKHDGPGIVRLFAGGSGERSEERLRVRADIRAAFRSGGEEFEVYYQPLISIKDRSVLAVEALVRWRRDGEVLLPADFLPDLVQSRSLPALTQHMLSTSLRELRRFDLPYPVTINVPPHMIERGLADLLDDAVRASGSTSDQLFVEITEDAIMRNPGEAAATLLQIRQKGYRVLLDDFGTGWSGLSSLRDLAVDGIKLDASFVAHMTTDTTAAAIVRGVAQVAGELNVFVVFEGVADAQSLPTLDSFPQGYIQGFALARPMPISDLVRWSLINDGDTAFPLTDRESSEPTDDDKHPAGQSSPGWA